MHDIQRRIEMEENNNQEVAVVEEAVKEEDVKTVLTERGEKFTEEEWKSPVFKNGPTREQVEAWKDKYEDIYFTPFDGETYIWRTLYREEYREVVSKADMTVFDKEETFTDLCVLFPLNYSSISARQKKAGIPTTLFSMIMDKSGFVAQTAPIKL